MTEHDNHDGSCRLRCLVCQIRVPQTSTVTVRNHHLERIVGMIDRHLSAESADLVILPELSAISYSQQTFSFLDVLSEPDEGASFQFFSPVARKHSTAILYGFARKGRHRPRISMGLVKADGCFGGAYDKLHLCQYGASMEKDYFEPGDSLFVFDVASIPVAVIVCYDIRFAELSQALCDQHGARVLVHCCANFRDESFASWRDFAVTRAMENQVHLLAVNRAGSGYGGSMLCPPWRDRDHRIKRLSRKEILTCWDIRLEQTVRARERYSFLSDRRDYRNLPNLPHR